MITQARPSPLPSITRSHGIVCKGNSSSQWERANYFTKLTPLNRQSPNIAHVITSTISAHMPHFVKIAPAPYIQSYHSVFFLYTQNLSIDLALRIVRSTYSKNGNKVMLLLQQSTFRRFAAKYYLGQLLVASASVLAVLLALFVVVVFVTRRVV